MGLGLVLSVGVAFFVTGGSRAGLSSCSFMGSDFCSATGAVVCGRALAALPAGPKEISIPPLPTALARPEGVITAGDQNTAAVKAMCKKAANSTAIPHCAMLGANFWSVILPPAQLINAAF